MPALDSGCGICLAPHPEFSAVRYIVKTSGLTTSLGQRNDLRWLNFITSKLLFRWDSGQCLLHAYRLSSLWTGRNELPYDCRAANYTLKLVRPGFGPAAELPDKLVAISKREGDR